MANTNFLNWEWASSHVQVELENGEYVSAESTLILSGPSQFSMLQGSIDAMAGQLYPLGILQNIQIAQNRQVARLFEIGSKRSYFVPGRLFANFQMNRILFYGPSLMRLLYAVAPPNNCGSNIYVDRPAGATAKNNNFALPNVNPEYKKLFPSLYSLSPGEGGNDKADNRDFWINLASEVFNVPMGLCLLFKDARQRPFGAFYMENCMIEAHSMGVDSNNIVLAEGVNGQVEMIKPIKVMPLTTGL
jgi:hypothetical protein